MDLLSRLLYRFLTQVYAEPHGRISLVTRLPADDYLRVDVGWLRRPWVQDGLCRMYDVQELYGDIDYR